MARKPRKDEPGKRHFKLLDRIRKDGLHMEFTGHGNQRHYFGTVEEFSGHRTLADCIRYGLVKQAEDGLLPGLSQSYVPTTEVDDDGC